MADLRPAALTALIEALDARGRAIGDWSARSREVMRVEIDTGGAVRVLRRLDVAARVHVDGPTGRGSADLAIDGGLAAPDAGTVAPRITEAIERAELSIGPGWRAAPPAAPARVSMGDTRTLDPHTTARALLDALAGAAEREKVALVEAHVGFERATVLVETSRGLAARWSESVLAVQARIADGAITARLAGRARVPAGIDPAALVADAAGRARLRSRATAVSHAADRTPGVLVSAALLGGDGAPLLGALGALADASLHRQGLARVAVGKPIAAGAATVEEPLSVTSDGTLPLGLRSAPLAEHGEAVRQFPIVDRGVLVGVGLDEREAALREVPPNGGVRNLVLSPGGAEPGALRGDGVLELLEIDHVEIERLTGHGAIGVGLALLHQGDAATPVVGGELQGDLVAAFARSRRDRDTVHTGSYSGPTLILLSGLRLV